MVFAVLWIAIAVLVPGCYLPLASEAVERARHADARNRPLAKGVIEKQLAELSCIQLSDWEKVVLSNLRKPEALSLLSTQVLRDDVSRIREAMAMRSCPSREQMLAAGTPRPAKGSTLKFACACWQPYGATPIAKEGSGLAGAGCVTVRAEVSPGKFAFIENVPTWGDRRHEFDRSDSFPLVGSLGRLDMYALTWGVMYGMVGFESDGWIETDIGPVRLLADDCKPLSAEQAGVAERTVIRWVEEP